MADIISHAQKQGGSPEHVGWNGVQVNRVRRPLTNEEIDENARKLRERQGLDKPPSQTLAQRTGIPHEVAQFLQRLEARVLELEREVKALRQPAHMTNVERR